MNPKAELYGGNCIEDTRDPFIFPRYRVSSVTVRISESVEMDVRRTLNL